MNPTTDQLPPPPPPPALPLQPPRSSFSCDRHPDENFTGFCPSCLCERLTTLDQSANAAASSSSRRNSTSSTAAAALKSIFRVTSSSNTTFEAYKNTATTKTSFFPELRRTKSFSASKNEGLGFSAGVFEPQRKSCDVRNTLWSLFSIDDVNKPRLSSAQQQTLGNTGTVLETNKEDEEEEEDQVNDDENIEVSEEQESRNVNDSENNIVEEVAEIEEEEDAIVDDLKTMKDHIDLDSQSKKPSLSNLWSAASVLSKKWQKWRRKQKKSSDDCNGVLSSSTLPVAKAKSRQYRETQSEIADYGFGRRSCDVDPRFSLDAGRISFDDPRYSFDEPRASWDGYMIGRTFPRLPPMVEDVPVAVVQVPRSDMQISVEEPANADDIVPGGSIQTREYYSDSSSKRRKSLDRSNSIRKMAAAVVAEMDETKVVSNAKVSPATIDYNYNPGGLRFPSIGGERELARVSNSNSLRDDCSETFELGFRDNNHNGVEKKDGNKKGRRWRWKLWGFIHRRGGGGKEEEDDGFSRVNVVERSYSEREGGGNRKVFRSNSSVSWRNSSKKLNPETNGFGNGNNRRAGGDEFVLERNRSARYSPNHTDSGLLRFYLTPLRGSRRSGIGIGTGKSRPISNSAKTLLKPGEGGWKVKP
ncbi:hypothetical protein L6452_02461 [Arctium lappa]|uniref:Uncharacterized protein n=1 Tax=Arctium lappa TaxID=4217 RepID=A0ACB9FJ49_ARCLA|nr:hypothetical protein L6452_02461 [Arctium lappa]